MFEFHYKGAMESSPAVCGCVLGNSKRSQLSHEKLCAQKREQGHHDECCLSELLYFTEIREAVSGSHLSQPQSWTGKT